MIDLSESESPVIKSLTCQGRFIESDRADLAHLVLPRLDIQIKSYQDPEALAAAVIDCLWDIFNSVRDWYLQCKTQDASLLVWAWPGETTSRPGLPQHGIVEDPIQNSCLSLLPSLSGMLRCMALELERPIALICTDSSPQDYEILDFKEFFMGETIALGDFMLSRHRLYSHEPRLTSVADTKVDLNPCFKGHVLSLGGGRGIVSEMLSRLISPDSHLSVVGRTALESPDEKLVGLSTTELMRALMEKYRNSGNHTPMNARILQQEAEHIGRQFALSDQLKFLRHKVAAFDYHSVDLLVHEELDKLLNLDEMSNVNVLISGAGVIQDQSCLKKSKQSFEAVLRTKVAPLCVFLLKGLPSQLKTWICFSSIASKSGNPGQADYAAANEFLNTVVHWFSRHSRDICIRTVNWGPWKGSGMASDEVLKAFHSRGLEPIEADDAASMIRHLLSENWNSVEVSGVSLQRHVIRRIAILQNLLDNSPLWSYHSLPSKDMSSSDEWPLAFHGRMPYLQGHKKNELCVVPAATILALTADLPSALGISDKQPIQLNLYVFNGITMADSQVVVKTAQVHVAEDCRSGSLIIRQHSSLRKHYQVSWTSVDDSSQLDTSLTPSPKSLRDSYLKCDPRDVYASCLFHSGVMARLSSDVIIDPDDQTSWTSAKSAAYVDLFGVRRSSDSAIYFPNRDFATIDSLLQLLLVHVIETYGFSLLPQELSIVFHKEIPACQEVKLTVKILSSIGSCLEAIGSCFDLRGQILFTMKRSKFTVSHDLLDHPPGIAHQLTVLG